jgi:hypothetical protein
MERRGCQFLTPPKQHQYEKRCYIRDPDGHLIEGPIHVPKRALAAFLLSIGYARSGIRVMTEDAGEIPHIDGDQFPEHSDPCRRLADARPVP